MFAEKHNHKTIKEKFEVFLNEQRDKQLISTNTVRLYSKTINYFFNYLFAKKILRLNDIEVVQIERFIEIKDTKTEKRYAIGTQKVRAAALSSFFDWAYNQGYCRNNLSLSYKITNTQQRYYYKKNINITTKVPCILNQHEVKKLLTNFINDEELIFIRDKAIIALMLSSGIYAHEICTLPVNAINLTKHQLKIENIQGVNRFIKLDKSIYYEPLKNWIEVRKAYLNNQKHFLLFFSTRFNPISQRTLHRIVATQFEKAGITKSQKGSDILRQTAIVIKLASGMPAKKIKSTVGFKSLLTINDYLQLVNLYLQN